MFIHVGSPEAYDDRSHMAAYSEAGGKYDAMLGCEYPRCASARIGARYVNLSSNPWEEDESGHEQAARTAPRRGPLRARQRLSR